MTCCDQCRLAEKHTIISLHLNVLMKNILFLCVHNSCRSQMAEAWLNHLAKDTALAHSAWSKPTCVDPLIIEVMHEVDVDMTWYTSIWIEELPSIEWDYIITVCDREKEACPFVQFPNAVYIHQSFSDPDWQSIDAYRSVRDTIRIFVEWLIGSL